jgi:hypothetical protein
MKRFDFFVQLLSVACIINDIRSGHNKAVNAIGQVHDPNVHAMIELGTDETVEKKVTDYVNYIYFGAPKPHWFVLSNEGNQHPGQNDLGVPNS